ncbi:MAG: PrsW family intramembrane metalloprotease [Anaerolineales bacterium]|nr:PrsW family intramembrane metalloprotease [Anaerolineales bacterium]
MMQTKPTTHWASILILVILAIGIFFFLSVAFVMGLISLVDLLGKQSQPVTSMIIAFSAGAEFIVLLMSAWFVFQKAANKATAEKPLQFAFPVWLGPTLIVLTVVALSIGTLAVLVQNVYVSWLTLPVATLLVIIPPIGLFIGLGLRRLELGPRWRIWGALGLGLTVGPAIMIFLEVLVVALIWLGVTLFLYSQPEKLHELQRVGKLLLNENNEEALLSALGRYLTNPRVLLGIFGYLSLLIPMIEEFFKPLAVWLFARKLETPTQGFALGIISGGAFALIESLNAGADSSEAWIVLGLARAGASLLHILLTGLMGYAIVGAFKEKRFGRLALTYGAVIAIHGLWNAYAIGASIFGGGPLFGKPEWINFLPASIFGIMTLSVGMFVLIFVVNSKLRVQSAPPPVETPKENG